MPYKRRSSKYCFRSFLRLALILILLTSLAGSLPVSTAQAASTLYVIPGGDGDCLNWSSACNLPIALGKAQSGDQIWVAGGVYTPTVESANREASFHLVSGVKLYGGFTIGETNLEGRDFANNVSVLSGDIDDNDTVDADGVVTRTMNIEGENSYHIVIGSGVTETAVLDGFTITAGYADGAEEQAEDCGAGMYNENGSPTLTNITFSGNFAEGDGGGMYNIDNSNSILTNVIFSGNSLNQGGYGGGMYNANSNPMLTNVTFSENSILESDGGGAGMYNHNGSPSLIDVVFIDNLTNIGGDGGGMYNNYGTPVLTSVNFIDNRAYYGGGIYNNDSSNPILENVIFNGNYGSPGGGMYNIDNSNPILTNVTFSHNSEGALANFDDSSPTLINVIFDDNHSGLNGGGIRNYNNSNPILINVTFNRNSAEHGDGGGILNYNSHPTLTNCILWGNTGSPNTQIFNDGDGSSILLYSLVQDGCPTGSTCDEHLLTDNPLFVDADSGDLRLQSTSPAIDAGDNTTSGLAGITSDLDGNPRFMDVLTVDDTGNGTPPIVDLGAYEFDGQIATTIQLKAVPNPSQLDETVTFTATVSAIGSELIPTGSVKFFVDEEAAQSVALNEAGIAIYTRDDLGAGSHTLTAQYIGDANFAASTSEPLGLMIGKQESLTLLDITPNPVLAGQMITMTASVSSTAHTPVGVPTGNVGFYTDETLLGTSDLNQGRAIFTTSALEVGSYLLTAQYAGDTNFISSTSESVNVVVNSPDTYLPLVFNNWPPVITLEDAPNLCGDAYPIQLDTHAYRDDFDAANDADWYRINAAQGSTYLAEALELGDNLIPVLLLYDSSCQSILSQGTQMGDSTILQWTHEWPSGLYHLLVYEAYGRSGTDTGYEFSAKTNP